LAARNRNRFPALLSSLSFPQSIPSRTTTTTTFDARGRQLTSTDRIGGVTSCRDDADDS